MRYLRFSTQRKLQLGDFPVIRRRTKLTLGVEGAISNKACPLVSGVHGAIDRISGVRGVSSKTSTGVQGDKQAKSSKTGYGGVHWESSANASLAEDMLLTQREKRDSKQSLIVLCCTSGRLRPTFPVPLKLNKLGEPPQRTLW